MEEVSLSKLQQAYLSGRNTKGNLGGVPCHVYIEVNGREVSYEKLQKAWSRVIHRHPVLSAHVEEQSRLVFDSSSRNEKLMLFDFRNTTEEETKCELQHIRKAFSHRQMHVEYGHSCGLCLSLLPIGETRIHFDFDLTAGDVIGFQILLRDLADFYDGMIDTDVYCIKEQSCEPLLKDQFFWTERIYDIPNRFSLKQLNNCDLLYGCEYFNKHCCTDKKSWDWIRKKACDLSILPTIALMAISAIVIHKFASVDSFWLNIPIFGDDLRIIQDSTKIVLVESKYKTGDTFETFVKRLFQEYEECCLHSSYSGLEVQNMIHMKTGSNWVAPIVFSSTPQIALLSERFCKCFGELHYMVSQTPHVWIDMQVHEIMGEEYTYWMIPNGLFENKYIDSMFGYYEHMLNKISEYGSDWNNIIMDEGGVCYE